MRTLSSVTEIDKSFQSEADRAPFLFVSHASLDNARLKPVIQALLGEGLPLWFDKPGDLNMSISDFAGHIPIGKSWSEELIDQMMFAHGMIYFPTENYEASKECIFEKAQASIHRRKSNNRFKMMALALSDKDFQSFDGRQVGIQGAKAFVVEQEGEWILDPRRSADLKNLIQELRKQLAQPQPIRTAAEDEREQKSTPREYSIPYRINRDTEKQRVEGAHSRVLEECAYNLREPSPVARRPVFVCHGSARDEHSKFSSTSLNAAMEQSLLFNPGPASERPVRPKWPAGSDFKRSYKNNVINILSDRVSIPLQSRSADETAILANAIFKDETTLVVSTLLVVNSETESNFKQLKNDIQSWVSFWDEFPFQLADGEKHFHVLPVLEVVYKIEKAKGFSLRKSLPQAVHDFLISSSTAAGLSRGCTSVCVEILKPFEPISRPTVQTWIRDDEAVFDFPQSKREKIETDICRQIFKEEDRTLKMRDWAEEAGPILSKQYKIGI